MATQSTRGKALCARGGQVHRDSATQEPAQASSTARDPHDPPGAAVALPARSPGLLVCTRKLVLTLEAACCLVGPGVLLQGKTVTPYDLGRPADRPVLPGTTSVGHRQERAQPRGSAVTSHMWIPGRGCRVYAWTWPSKPASSHPD